MKKETEESAYMVPKFPRPRTPHKFRGPETPRNLFSGRDVETEASNYAFIKPNDALLHTQSQQLDVLRTQINRTAGTAPKIVHPVTAIGNTAPTVSLLSKKQVKTVDYSGIQRYLQQITDKILNFFLGRSNYLFDEATRWSWPSFHLL
jgi:hypothetical protein